MKNNNLINACLACIAACEYCASQCINMADKDHLRCISLCRDCVEICYLCLKSNIRDSEYAKHIANLCADICSACAEECGKFSGHEHCRKCAEACSKCAEQCLAA
ncbi:four-helix bundle copper-binding protein [Flavobacterium sp. NRK1]|jgi:hypothetical protein|uniref:four-helix bundle copper-binding protein n=1 Tax=Flavobacterium sp. NRK1 TaxID=2954929 RepID=UPI00209311A7|nr:four-helix bundle copper-binding protein [Flavobacterium sp. NRK1]MCO6149291.1 four-helix bundle copper-binding protein [Flavobacterium sp. NRK1]